MVQPRQSLAIGDALVLVDLQNDFCPGGALAIEGGDKAVPVLNRWIRAAMDKKIPVFASRDWHPLAHVSFVNQGGDWPPHCLQDTPGADFHPGLQLPHDAVKIAKGVRFDKDQYSVFDETGLAKRLRSDRVKRLWVGGLAQDVCVLQTVLDACKKGFQVRVITDATYPVSAAQGEKALEAMSKAGAEWVTTD